MNPVPLCADALTGFLRNTDNRDELNKAAQDASVPPCYSTQRRLMFEVIPVFAETLDSEDNESIGLKELINRLHRTGINIRHLGYVRASRKRVFIMIS